MATLTVSPWQVQHRLLLEQLDELLDLLATEDSHASGHPHHHTAYRSRTGACRPDHLQIGGGEVLSGAHQGKAGPLGQRVLRRGPPPACTRTSRSRGATTTASVRDSPVSAVSSRARWSASSLLMLNAIPEV